MGPLPPRPPPPAAARRPSLQRCERDAPSALISRLGAPRTLNPVRSRDGAQVFFLCVTTYTVVCFTAPPACWAAAPTSLLRPAPRPERANAGAGAGARRRPRRLQRLSAVLDLWTEPQIATGAPRPRPTPLTPLVILASHLGCKAARHTTALSRHTQPGTLATHCLEPCVFLRPHPCSVPCRQHCGAAPCKVPLRALALGEGWGKAVVHPCCVSCCGAAKRA